MTVTERTRVDGKLLEETNIAVPTFKTEWDYISTGPYRVQRRYTSDEEGTAHVWDIAHGRGHWDIHYGWEQPVSPTVEYAVGLFAEVAFPMQYEATVVLMDESFRCILGYTTMWGGIEGVGMGWWGTGETFAVLEQWSDIEPMELAVWESIARRYVS